MELGVCSVFVACECFVLTFMIDEETTKKGELSVMVQTW